jgi:hypothetical protein
MVWAARAAATAGWVSDYLLRISRSRPIILIPSDTALPADSA